MINELTGVLRGAGIDHVYGVAGEASGAFAQAVLLTDEITCIQLPTEEAAAFAAAEEAHATGQLAVCAGSNRAGKTDLIHGLRDAHELGAPVLAVASYGDLHETVGGVLHEIHPERLFAECSVYCGVVDEPSQVSRLARSAIQHALVRGGVAVLLLDSFVTPGASEVTEWPPPRRSSGNDGGGRQSAVRLHRLRADPCVSRRRRPHGR
jgi:pyruvate dehydrogenase (quinone)